MKNLPNTQILPLGGCDTTNHITNKFLKKRGYQYHKQYRFYYKLLSVDTDGKKTFSIYYEHFPGTGALVWVNDAAKLGLDNPAILAMKMPKKQWLLNLRDFPVILPAKKKDILETLNNLVPA
jgi:hypothetical protein